MTERRQARILAMQALCQLEVLGADFLAQLDDFLADDAPAQGVRDYAGALVRDAWQNFEHHDSLIQQSAEHWEIKRMAVVDRNTLRVAACELLLRPELPPAVVINEAIEIAREFGTAESAGFINGVLDALRTRHEAERKSLQPE